MPKYEPLVRTFAKWLYQFIDRQDWGRFVPNLGHPMPILSREEFLFRKNAPRHLHPFRDVPKLTMTTLTEHLAKREVIFYRSFRRAERWLLNIDIDAKNESQTSEGAEAAALHIATKLHKGLYYEPSTGGKGRHVYLVVERGFLPYDQWKALLAHYVTALKIICLHKKIPVAIDRICGMPTKLSSAADENCEHVFTIKEGHCGILSKIPTLPMSELGLNHLMTSPVLKAEDFQRVIEKAEKLRAKVKDKLALAASDRNRNQYDMLTRLGSAYRLNVENVRAEPNAFRRMHFACTLFTMARKRFADSELELCEYYEQNDFHSGNSAKDRQIRLKRAQCVLNFQRQRRCEETMGVFGFDVSTYVELVEKHVRAEHWEGVKVPGDRGVSKFDLACCLYVMERNAMKKSPTRRRQGTTGFKSIIDMSKVLRDAGVLPRASNPNQACAARKVLVNAGLATCEDAGYYAGGSEHGWCRKYGMGVNHPQQQVYEQFKAEINKDTVEQYPVDAMPVHECDDLLWEVRSATDENREWQNIEGDNEEWAFEPTTERRALLPAVGRLDAFWEEEDTFQALPDPPEFELSG